jgi:hypothetical protein
MKGWNPCSLFYEKEFHMRSKEVRTAAATCSTESPVVGVDASWTSKVTGGAFRTLRSLPVDFIGEFE